MYDAPVPGGQAIWPGHLPADLHVEPNVSARPRLASVRPVKPAPLFSNLSVKGCSILTEVRLTSIEGRFEQWLRFGRVAEERSVSEYTHIAAFRPGAVFALVRCIFSDFGMTFASIDIVAAVAPGAPCAPMPFVRPGGDVLLHAETWPRVAQVLGVIDAVEAAGIDPCDASPYHWREIAGLLNEGRRSRPYTTVRHAAWLRRRRLEP